LAIGGVLCVPLILASCSGGGGSATPTPNRASPACAYVTKLDQIADSVARANVHDPDAFNATLESAVTEYVANVKALAAVTPSSLHPSLLRVEADVQQYRFAAALTDRADLDAYAQRVCGRVITTATTVSPTTSVTTPPDTGTVPATGSTATTAPSDG
jgi:hypothetical protein